MITQSEGKVEQSSRLIRTASQQQCPRQGKSQTELLFHWFEICYTAGFFLFDFFQLVLNVIKQNMRFRDFN